MLFPGCFWLLDTFNRYDEFKEKLQPLVNNVNKKEAIQILGAPINKMQTPDGEEWYYQYPQTLNLIYKDKDSTFYDYLTVHFDKTDTLRYWSAIITSVPVK